VCVCVDVRVKKYICIYVYCVCIHTYVNKVVYIHTYMYTYMCINV